jgi:predicted DNA-binding WGR domain protein
MKVLDQARLWFQQGKSDKVYEVDLVEVVDGQHVVNFRYGRRGAALRDGTKTPTPVPLAKARAVFDALVAEKTREGYVPMGAAGAPSPATLPVAPPSRPVGPGPAEASLDAPSRALLAELRRGTRSKTPLHLVIRKVGERGIAAAEPLLQELLMVGKPPRGVQPRVWQHHLIAALARCGSAASIATLEPLATSVGAAPHVRAVAQLALAMIGARSTDEGVRAAAEARSLALLHPPVAAVLRTGEADALAAVIERELTLAPGAMLQTLLALSMLPGPAARSGVLAAARVIAVGEAFAIVRALFWSAELRRDGELYAVLAQRIERHVGTRQCQPATRAYFRRRVARTLRRLGSIGSPDFVRMAAALTLRYTDAHAEPPRQGAFGARYDEFAFYHALNVVLFAGGQRYERAHHGRATWRRADGYRVEAGLPTDREEAFPELWDRDRAQLWTVVAGARATPVARFAVRALRDDADFTAQLPDDAVANVMGDAPMPDSQRFAFTLARGRTPNPLLVRGALRSSVDEAHAWVVAWVRGNPALVLASDELLSLLITADAASAREAALALVQAHRVDVDVARGTLLRVVAILMGLPVGAASSARAAGALAVVLRGLPDALPGVSEDAVRDLLGHAVAEVAALGAEIVLARARRGDVPTALLDALLGSPHAPVRAIGARILAETPPAVAKDLPDVLIGFALSANVELRDGTRGLIGAVARGYPEVGRVIAAALVLALLRKLPDGAPAHAVALLRAELAGCLPRAEAPLVLRLCGALSPHARDAGALLLPQLGPDELGLDDVARLVSHEAVAVRRAAQALAEAARDRYALAPTALARLCDATWDDSRAWAFAFVRTFPGDVLAPDGIIAICDSVRPAVQDLGKALLREHFRHADAGRYLLRLAEHPSTNVQLLVSELLGQHGAGDLDRLRALLPFLTTVLSQVNRGGVAKRRVLAFVAAEAAASAEAAAVLAPLLDRQSATDSVSHKHPLIATMVAVRTTYPEVPSLLELVPVAPLSAGGLGDGAKGGV